MTDLLMIAEAQIAEKQVREIEAIKKQLDADREVLNKAIELVNSHTLYKKVSTGRSAYKYVLATEEMLKEDYISEPKRSYCHKGIRFLDSDGFNKSYNTGVFEVNGETYYDIHYALERYEKSINDKILTVSHLNERINELKNDLKEMEENYPTLKKAVIEWQEYEKKMSEQGE